MRKMHKQDGQAGCGKGLTLREAAPKEERINKNGGVLTDDWNPSGKIGDFATSRVVDGFVSLVSAERRKARSLRISSFPHRTLRTGWASVGTPMGEAFGRKLFSPP